MDKKEEKVQKALGTFDHFKCRQCGKLSHESELVKKAQVEPLYSIGDITSGPMDMIVTGHYITCTCGSEEFE